MSAKKIGVVETFGSKGFGFLRPEPISMQAQNFRFLRRKLLEVVQFVEFAPFWSV